MGRAARIKREFNDAMNKSIQPKMASTMKKIEREIRRDGGLSKQNYMGKVVLTPIPTFKEWPCQKSTGKALLPISVVPYKKDDGLLYYSNKDGEETLVVCENYLLKQERIKYRQMLRDAMLKNKQVQNMEPTQLGEND